MACYQTSSLPSGISAAGRTPYKTQAECLQACKEGACCEGTACTVKPQCQCQGAGKTFMGVGTVCSPSPCNPLP
jgi:N-acetylmuramic acid 6-phosphate (MurNAc-6-P) etherase